MKPSDGIVELTAMPHHEFNQPTWPEGTVAFYFGALEGDLVCGGRLGVSLLLICYSGMTW